jgi:hypothetical protein
MGALERAARPNACPAMTCAQSLKPELIGRLGLQLIVVTPLRNVSTIGPFGEAVGASC